MGSSGISAREESDDGSDVEAATTASRGKDEDRSKPLVDIGPPLAHAIRQGSLQTLDLSFTGVGAKETAALLDAVCNSRLKVINLSGNDVAGLWHGKGSQAAFDAFGRIIDGGACIEELTLRDCWPLGSLLTHLANACFPDARSAALWPHAGRRPKFVEKLLSKLLGPIGRHIAKESAATAPRSSPSHPGGRLRVLALDAAHLTGELEEDDGDNQYNTDQYNAEQAYFDQYNAEQAYLRGLGQRVRRKLAAMGGERDSEDEEEGEFPYEGRRVKAMGNKERVAADHSLSHLLPAGALGRLISSSALCDSLQVLSLRDNERLSDKGVRALVAGLGTAHTLTSLDLSACDVGPTGALVLSCWLTESHTLTELLLTENVLYSFGVCAICEALDKSRLVTLSLKDNGIGKQGGRALIEAIQRSIGLTDLDISANPELSGSIAKELAEVALSTSSRIEKLSGIPLQLMRQGGVPAGRLDLSERGLGPTEAWVLAGLLAAPNGPLTELNASSNLFCGTWRVGSVHNYKGSDQHVRSLAGRRQMGKKYKRPPPGHPGFAGYSPSMKSVTVGTGDESQAFEALVRAVCASTVLKLVQLVHILGSEESDSLRVFVKEREAGPSSQLELSLDIGARDESEAMDELSY